MIIEDLLDELADGSPEAEELARVLGEQIYFANRNTGITDAQHRVQQTWLVGEVPVTLDENGDGRDPIGDAYFDRINLASGLSATINADEPRQIDITAAGGTGSGADCMFDYLVSTCFTTLAGFTEGEVFTSISGCTFKGYSTVGGMVAQAFIDFGVSNVATAYICRGTYLETNIVFAVNHWMRWVGSGRTRTIIGTNAVTTTDTIPMNTASQLQVSGMTIRASTAGASTKGGINLGAASTLIGEDAIFRGRNVTTSDTVSFGIIGGSTATVRLIDCELQRNGFISANEAVAEFSHVYHTGGGVGIRTLNNTLINGCFFNASAIGVLTGPETQITGSHFEDCTAGVTSTSSLQRVTITDNHFDSCVTDIDLTSFADSSVANIQIANNHGTQLSSATFIKWPTSASFLQGSCLNNVTDGAGSFSSGIIPTYMRVGPNYEGAGLARGDIIGSGLNGIVQVDAGGDSKTVRWNAFVVFFGTSKIIANPGSFSYSTNNTYYISVAVTGVVTANTLLGFPVGEFPLGIAITNIVGTITGFEWYDGNLRTTATGSSAAPSDASYVTMGLAAGLSAERVLTAGAGISILDGGPNSTVTISATAASSVIKQMYISFGEIPGVPYSA